VPLPDPYTLSPPNIRAMLVPDPGYCFAEVDLSGADAQVVAWEAGAENLKRKLQASYDLHTENAYHIYGRDISHPRHTLHVNGMTFRDNAKRAVHAANYAVSYRTLAQSTSITEARATAFLNWWAKTENPAIGEWHEKTEYTLRSRRMPVIRNAWGFRKTYTERYSPQLLHQALAWIAQSTVGVTINKIMCKIDCCLDLLGQPRCGKCLVCRLQSQGRFNDLQLQLQIHDSVLMQIRLDCCGELFPLVLEAAKVSIPYADPLVIPCELKWSPVDFSSMEKWDDSK
jgi:DNA polymerase I-like protein with 3'-5' exonuclease and polymerase domains